MSLGEVRQPSVLLFVWSSLFLEHLRPARENTATSAAALCVQSQVDYPQTGLVVPQCASVSLEMEGRLEPTPGLLCR